VLKVSCVRILQFTAPVKMYREDEEKEQVVNRLGAFK
jgi:hypothetical protein